MWGRRDPGDMGGKKLKLVMGTVLGLNMPETQLEKLCKPQLFTKN